MSNLFAWHRARAIIIKEFIQMMRDEMTFVMMAVIPIVQIVLFGYAINVDPKNLPTAALIADNTHFSRSIIQAMQTSGYFEFSRVVNSEKEGHQLLKSGDAQVVVSIPPNFTKDVISACALQSTADNTI